MKKAISFMLAAMLVSACGSKLSIIICPGAEILSIEEEL